MSMPPGTESPKSPKTSAIPNSPPASKRRREDLRNKFSAAFWSDELGMFALALDGKKRQCRVRSSNAGQCLFSGIASSITDHPHQRIAAIARPLLRMGHSHHRHRREAL